jgi:hypothetical protein
MIDWEQSFIITCFWRPRNDPDIRYTKLVYTTLWPYWLADKPLQQPPNWKGKKRYYRWIRRFANHEPSPRFAHTLHERSYWNEIFSMRYCLEAVYKSGGQIWELYRLCAHAIAVHHWWYFVLCTRLAYDERIPLSGLRVLPEEGGWKRQQTWAGAMS